MRSSVEHWKVHNPLVAAWMSGPLMVALAVAAHSVSGDPVPAVSILAVLTALLSIFASIFAHLRFPVWGLLLLSGLVQQVLHRAFSLFSGAFEGSSAEHGHGVFIRQLPLVSSASSPAHSMELLLHAHVAAALLAGPVIAKWESLMSSGPSLRGHIFSADRPYVAGPSSDDRK
jgi:hypothetical protein